MGGDKTIMGRGSRRLRSRGAPCTGSTPGSQARREEGDPTNKTRHQPTAWAWRVPLLVVALLGSMAQPGVARAGSLTDGRFGHQVVELRHRVRATIRGVLCQTDVTLALRARGEAPEEAILTFQTPPGARVTGLWARLHGRWVPGALLSAAAIRRAVQDTRDIKARPDPAWLEQTGPDRYRLRVYPVPHRGRVELRYRYLHAATLRWGHRIYVYPSRGKTPTRAPALVTLVDHGLWGSPARRKHVLRVPPGVPLERPLSDPPIPRAQPLRAGLLAVPAATPGAPSRALLILQGNPAASRRRWGTDVVFLVDGSRSMWQRQAHLIPAMIRAMARTLGPQTRAGIARFHRRARRVTPRLLSTRDAHFTRALGRLGRLPLHNGSSLQAGLRASYGLLGRGRTARRRLVVVLTDGLVRAREIERGLWPDAPPGTELLLLVGRPGGGVARRLRSGPLARLARRHGGLAFGFDPELHGEATPSEQRASLAAAVRLAAALARPGRLTDLRVRVAGTRISLPTSDLTLVGGLLRWVTLPASAPRAAQLSYGHWGRRVVRTLPARPLPRALAPGLALLFTPDAAGAPPSAASSSASASGPAAVSPSRSLIVVDPRDSFGRDRLRFARRWGDRFFRRFAPVGSLDLTVGPFHPTEDAGGRPPTASSGRAAPGHITRAMVRRLLLRHYLPAATRCYQATGPKFRAGHAVLTVELTRGEVVDAWLAHDSLKNPALRQCLVAAAGHLRVPHSWADETLYRVAYPMRFRPADHSVSELRGWRPPRRRTRPNPLRGLR